MWTNLSAILFFQPNALDQRSGITIQRLRQTQKNISTRGINITTALLILLDQSRRNLCSGRKFITSESGRLPQLLQPCLWMPQTITPIKLLMKCENRHLMIGRIKLHDLRHRREVLDLSE